MYSVARDVAKLIALEPGKEWSCPELAQHVIIDSGPSRFLCPPAYMKRVLDNLVSGGHLAKRRAKSNLYRLAPEAATRPALPEGWFYGVHRGSVKTWPVVWTDQWADGYRVTLGYDAAAGTMDGGASEYATLAHRRGERHARSTFDGAVKAHPGWQLASSVGALIVVPWAQGAELAAVLAGMWRNP